MDEGMKLREVKSQPEDTQLESGRAGALSPGHVLLTFEASIPKKYIIMEYVLLAGKGRDALSDTNKRGLFKSV